VPTAPRSVTPRRTLPGPGTRRTHLHRRPLRDWLMTPTRANGQPAAATYYRTHDGTHQALGVAVLTATPTGIARITVFPGGPSLVARFGLPFPTTSAGHRPRRQGRSRDSTDAERKTTLGAATRRPGQPLRPLLIGRCWPSRTLARIAPPRLVSGALANPRVVTRARIRRDDVVTSPGLRVDGG
jgi:hypothetical protein